MVQPYQNNKQIKIKKFEKEAKVIHFINFISTNDDGITKK